MRCLVRHAADNIGKYAFPAIQAAPSFSSSFPDIFGKDSNMPCTALSMQHAARNMQHATCLVQHATCSMQHAICNMPCAARSERWSQKPTRSSELSQHRTVSRGSATRVHCTPARPHTRGVCCMAWRCSLLLGHADVHRSLHGRAAAQRCAERRIPALPSTVLRVLYCAGLIPCAIDQDPYFRMTRDVRTRQPPRGQVYVPGVLTSLGKGHFGFVRRATWARGTPGK